MVANTCKIPRFGPKQKVIDITTNLLWDYEGRRNIPLSRFFQLV